MTVQKKQIQQKNKRVVYHRDKTVSVYDPSVGRVVRDFRINAHQKLWIGFAECERVYRHTGNFSICFDPMEDAHP